MQLKEFIRATMEEIVDGVAEAQKSVGRIGAIINPASLTYSGSSETIFFDGENGRPVQTIKFNIAVTTVETGQAKGGAGIFVGSFGLGGQAQTGSANTQDNRIAFSVPLELPIQATQKE